MSRLLVVGSHVFATCIVLLWSSLTFAGPAEDCEKATNDEAGIASCTKAIAENASNSNFYWWRAYHYRRLSQFQQALSDLKKATELNPKFVKDWIELGWVLNQLSRDDEARVAFDKAIELDPKNARAYTLRSVTFGDGGPTSEDQFEKARTDLMKALELDPKYTLAYVNLGQRSAWRGECYDAMPPLDKAIELGEKTSSIFYWRGLCQLLRFNEE